MEGLFFNVNNGYIEGIVRGYRNGLLTGQNYNNLTQCETIDGELDLGSYTYILLLIGIRP
jgi:V-type H+-transporting ATPase subunit d